MDHGLTVPMNLLFGKQHRPDGEVILVTSNVVPSAHAHGPALLLSQAVRRAIESFDQPLKVQIWAWGGT